MIKQKLLSIVFFAKLRDCILYVRDYSKNHEMNKKYGKKNPDKTFYVIRSYTKEAGWGSILSYVCRHIKYALDNGYIPVVDMQNYHNAYEEDGEFRRVNVWEKFFYQPFGYSLDEVYESKNVILCGSQLANMGYIVCGKDPCWSEYSMIFSKYIKLNDDIEKVIKAEVKRIFGDETDGECRPKVLGVLCRGTDYTKLKPLYHSIPFSGQETLEELEKYIINYDKVYLATEDELIFELFRDKLSEEKLCYTNQLRFDEDKVDGYIADVSKKMGMDPIKKGIDYLKVLYTLASCESLLGAPCGGTYIAQLINGNKYKENIVLEKGIYT